jgi:hypothetical protein
MKLYGFGKFPASSGVPAKQAGCADEAEIVAALMERYREIFKKENENGN